MTFARNNVYLNFFKPENHFILKQKNYIEIKIIDAYRK